MSSATPLVLEADNAWVLELTSLKGALAHYQHTSDSATLQLQRRSLETIERQKQLEAENARLSRELEVLSRSPDKTPHPATLSVSELTLAHRRLSERLEITESLLLDKTTDLQNAIRKAENAVVYAEQCREAVERVRRKEESAKERARSLEALLRAALEEKAMAERAIVEYADLVRKLSPATPDATSPSSMSAGTSMHRHSHSSSPSSHLEASKVGMQRLLTEFNATTDSLHQEISRLHAELDEANARIVIEQRASEEDRTKLALSRVELEQYIADDRSAAKLVERYMKFSQTSIDLLQAALDSQRTRLEARVTSVDARNATLEEALSTSQSQTIKLRDVLDELTENISRESHGRRREVALRLKVVSREEQTVTLLRKLARRAQEGLERSGSSADDRPEVELLARVVDDLTQLVEAIDGEVPSAPSMSFLGLELSESNPQGSLARVISCQETVTSLVAEMQMETEKRLALEKRLADISIRDSGFPLPFGLATPSDLGLGESKETLVDHPIAVHPLTPFDRMVFANSQSTQQSPAVVEAQLPLPPRMKTPVEKPVLDITPETPVSAPLPPPSPVVDAPTEALTTPFMDVPTEIITTPSTDVRPNGMEPKSVTIAPVVEHIPVESAKDDSSELSVIIDAISRVPARHDATVASLRNCQSSLLQLKADFQASSTSSSNTSNTVLLKAYMERLSDYLEDARVEVEIRVADEIRLAKGYETMLAVGGKPSSGSQTLEARIQAFIAGEDPATVKAVENFRRKVDDLQHDIALIKHAVHENMPSNGADLASPSSVTATSSWSWTGLMSPSRSRPTSPAPTFGAVMTQRSPTSPGHANTASVASTQPTPVSIADLPFRITMPRPSLPVPVASNGNRYSINALGQKPRTYSSGGLSSPMGASKRLSSGLGVPNGRYPIMRNASSGIFASSTSSVDQLSTPTLATSRLHPKREVEVLEPRRSETDGDTETEGGTSDVE